MNKQKALRIAKSWLGHSRSPKELSYDEAENVLEGLGFTNRGGSSSHTSSRWSHSCLDISPEYFKYGILKISKGHSKGTKDVIREDGVKVLYKSIRELHGG